jgi:chromosome segregation ATPase
MIGKDTHTLIEAERVKNEKKDAEIAALMDIIKYSKAQLDAAKGPKEVKNQVNEAKLEAQIQELTDLLLYARRQLDTAKESKVAPTKAQLNDIKSDLVP